MNFGVWWCVAALAAACGAEKWQWPEQAESVRIDTKVRFTDQQDDNSPRGVQADEAPFQEASQTDGFYNRPRGAGRYPVHVDTYRPDSHASYSLYNLPKNYNSDGTLDSLQYCKCSSTPNCNPHRDSARACGEGKFLCCYKRPNKFNPPNSEYFNEIDDERPSLLPGSEGPTRPFPPPHGDLRPEYPGEPGRNPGVLVGPGGPSGVIGPAGFNGGSKNNPDVLVGPGGPTGIIGPTGFNRDSKTNPDVLVGPGGPSGVIGPAGFSGASKTNPDVLVGPGGPTGVIGPGSVHNNGPRDVGPSESAQRGILVGPGGPTGFIGPRGYGQRPVLVGPGGPTGIIGPRMRGFFNQYYGGRAGPGVLVGPGGPTGRIGPQGYYG